MNPQDFIFLNLGVALVIAVLFFRGRKQKSPTRLRFARSARPSQPPVERPKTSVEEGEEESERRSVNLNVMFNYNGHSWDAYEVLGVPAGSSMPAVDKAFNESLKTSRKESEEFLRAAYDSICSDRRKCSRA